MSSITIRNLDPAARASEANIVTRNTSGFEGCGLTFINPWHMHG